MAISVESAFHAETGGLNRESDEKGMWRKLGGTNDMSENASNASSRNPLLLNRREAAEYLGISKQTLAIWNCTGRHQVPFVKIGRLVKYRKSDLDAFIASNLKGAS